MARKLGFELLTEAKHAEGRAERQQRTALRRRRIENRAMHELMSLLKSQYDVFDSDDEGDGDDGIAADWFHRELAEGSDSDSDDADFDPTQASLPASERIDISQVNEEEVQALLGNQSSEDDEGLGEQPCCVLVLAGVL